MALFFWHASFKLDGAWARPVQGRAPQSDLPFQIRKSEMFSKNRPRCSEMPTELFCPNLRSNCNTIEILDSRPKKNYRRGFAQNKSDSHFLNFFVVLFMFRPFRPRTRTCTFQTKICEKRLGHLAKN